MAKTKFLYSRGVRSIEIPVTSVDPDGVALFELPRGSVESVMVVVDTAFNTSATLSVGISGDADYLVASQAIDVAGFFVCTLAHYLHDSAHETTLTATVSDKTVAGKLRLIINFCIDRDTVLPQGKGA